MQVVVLNGVNLDVLGRRDPAIYGGLSLSELETRIYEWASELGCHVRCRQSNHEGEYVSWCHDPDEHLLPLRLQELERGIARRAGERAPLHGLPLRRGRALRRGRRVPGDEARAAVGSRRAALRPDRIRG